MIQPGTHLLVRSLGGEVLRVSDTSHRYDLRYYKLHTEHGPNTVFGTICCVGISTFKTDLELFSV